MAGQLLGQVKTSENERWDLQLKGSGQTLYSRQGDGKAVLRSTIWEYLGSAALDGLGIPTTLALAMFGSEEEVYRETVEAGAMLLCMVPSHIRFGTFEYYFYQNRYDDLKILCDYTLDHYFPHLKNQKDPFLYIASRDDRQHGAAYSPVAICWILSRSDEFRQYVHPRYYHRLWALWIYGSIFRWSYLQSFRSRWTLCI